MSSWRSGWCYMKSGENISILANDHWLVHADMYMYPKIYKLFKKQQTNKDGHRCTVYSKDMKGLQNQGNTVKAQRGIRWRNTIAIPWGTRQLDKTDSLRSIYSHLMHIEPPISSCVGIEMRCGVFPIQLHFNSLAITSSTTSGCLHGAAWHICRLHISHRDTEK